MRGKYIILAVICLVISIAAGAIGYYYIRPYIPKEINLDKITKQVSTPTEEKKLYPYPNWMNRERKRALAVVIDNAREARPQSGLEKAEIVFEVPVEGGMTRFLSIMSGEDIELVGPIRSTRSAFVDLAAEYKAILVHAGGSQEGLEALEREGVDHLDEIQGGSQVGAAFWRVPDRPKPHNLYASSDSLRRAGTAQRYQMTTPPPQHKYLTEEDTSTQDTPGQNTSKQDTSRQDAPIKDGLEGKKVNDISIFYPNRDNHVRYTYNKEKLVFERYTAETPHVTAKGEQLVAANIVVQFVPHRYTDGDGHIQLILHGNGRALIFREGKVVAGSWYKDPDGFTRFYDLNGQSIPFVPGPTWIQVVTKGTRVDY